MVEVPGAALAIAREGTPTRGRYVARIDARLEPASLHAAQC